ncbi:MAG: DUF2125 domain-containing protein [Alphaproteobacteria bacterium]|jgi:hypothetical protein
MIEPTTRILWTNRLRSRAALWAFSLFLFLVASMTGLWFAGASMVRENIIAMATHLASDSGHFSAKTMKITGFPTAFEVHLTGIRLAGSGPRGPWDWQAEKMRAQLAPWQTSNIRFDLAGAHRVRVHAARMPLDLEITATHASGQIIRGANGAPDMFQITPKTLKIRESVTKQTITADQARIQLFHYKAQNQDPTEPSAGVIFDIDNVTLPKAAGKFLSPKIKKLSTEIMVLGSLPTPIDRVRLGRWSRSGGTLEIKKLDLAWGPATMAASGTFSLDDRLQPEASLAARITGHEQTVDALVAAGVIRARSAEGIKLVLTMMARRPAPDKPVEIRIPMTIQNRALYIGPARLFRIPKIRW